MVAEPLTSGLVGWLVAAAGTAVSRGVSNAVLGSAEEGELLSALSRSITDVIARLPDAARGDLDAALRERGDLLLLDEAEGGGPYAMLSDAVRKLVAPLALPGQTLDIHAIDPEWLIDALIQALIIAIRRGAVKSSALLGFAQLLGIERLELAQSRMENLLSVRTDSTSVNTLPRTVSDFVGRGDVLEQLVAIPENRDPSVVTVFSLEGMAGVGKTEVALCAAHQLQSRYPDYQLYIDLQGFTRGHPPLSPATSLESLLLATGVPAGGIPNELSQRASLWRARLAGKRALIVLDNAFDENQVRPLLPGAVTSLVFITSRRSMSALDDVRLVALDALDERSAASLFTKISGRATSDNPESVADIVRLCGRLPLAIRLVAGRFRRRRNVTVQDVVEELAESRSRLAHLRDGNRGVQLAFDVSYSSLAPELRLVFRRLGLHPGPDITTDAVAALAACSHTAAVMHIDELLSHNLLQELPGGRLVLHDLLRDYAHERVNEEENTKTRSDAEYRLLEMHARKANAVNEDLSRADEEPARLAGRRWAQKWLVSERSNLVACARLSVERGDGVAVQLARSVGSYLVVLGYMDDAEAIYDAAEKSGRQTGDLLGRVRGLLGLGEVKRFTARYGSAREHFGAAQTLCQDLSDTEGLADALYGLGEIERVTGDYDRAEHHYELARNVSIEAGDRRREANALRGMGELAQAVGDLDSARASYFSAHTCSTAGGDRQGQAFALLGLGEAERTAGNFAEAKVHYEAAHTFCVDAADRRGQANAAFGMAEIARAIDDYDEARRRYEDAYKISVELGNRRGQTHTLLGLGAISLTQNALDTSKQFYGDALALATEIGDRWAQGRALLALGDIAAREDDTRRAIINLSDALDAFTVAGAVAYAAETRRRLAELQ